MSDQINKKIEETLASIDGISAAEPKPFLLTRVNAALQKKMNNDQSIWSNIAAVLKKPAIAFSVLILIVFTNIAVLSGNGSFLQKKNSQVLSSTTKYDFAINVSGIYDIENQEP